MTLVRTQFRHQLVQKQLSATHCMLQNSGICRCVTANFVILTLVNISFVCIVIHGHGLINKIVQWKQLVHSRCVEPRIPSQFCAHCLFYFNNWFPDRWFKADIACHRPFCIQGWLEYHQEPTYAPTVLEGGKWKSNLKFHNRKLVRCRD